MFKLLAGIFCLLIPLQAMAAAISLLPLDAKRIAARQQLPPEAFAEALPISLDARRDGSWTLQGETLHWTHEIVVEHASALALALELEALQLPSGATLQIGAQHWQGPLLAKSLFTHHQPGARLMLQAQLPRTMAADFVLRAVQVQAAFRDPFAPAAATTAKAADACEVNFSCSTEVAVQQWGGAVVALIVLNTATCTGTLMNNSAGDARPYLLTAKHCQTGAGSNDPVRAAASLRVAWNAVSSCGAPLASAWGNGTSFTDGAVHRAQHGDTWLVELASRPSEQVSPWYAGFDAGDQLPTGTVTGLHHGAALQRQLLTGNTAGRISRTVSFLAGLDLLGWAFAPERGAAAAGSSGSALFDAHGRLIGTLSTGVTCTVGAPQVTYARLAQAWSGDGTPGGSLKPWLDPLGTGSSLAGKSYSGTRLPDLVAIPASAVVPTSAAGGSAGGGGAFSAALWLLIAALRRHRQIV